MDPQPPTAWLWLWSGGEGFKNIISNHKRSAKLLNGFEYESVSAAVPDLQEDLGDSAVKGCEGCPLGVAQLGAVAHGD